MSATASSSPLHLPAADAKSTLLGLFDDLLAHEGFGNLTVEMRLLKRGQKEVLLICGKQYRFVVDFEPKPLPGKAAAEP